MNGATDKRDPAQQRQIRNSALLLGGFALAVFIAYIIATALLA